MKRALLAIGCLLLALILIAAFVLVRSFTGRQTIPERAEFDGISVVKDGIVSVGIVPVGRNHVALIDAGTDAAGRAILNELSRRSLGREAVSAILLTHGHQDHIAAVPLFPKAKVMSLAEEAGVVEGREGTRGPLTRFVPVKPTGVRVTQLLHDGETFLVEDTSLRVFAVPGHTKGSAAYLVNGVLFLGDAADVTRDGTQVQSAAWIFSESQAEDRASLMKLSGRLAAEGADVRRIVFAHSGSLGQGLKPLAAYAASR